MPKLIVTHHAPDLDAVGSVWLLKRFLAIEYADAKVAFTNPGTTLPQSEVAAMAIDPNEVVHVDTGLGEFDHHQKERAQQHICASSLVLEYLCQVQKDKENDSALHELVALITDIDHFGELFWPEASHPRYCLMLHELLHGLENLELHDDDSMLHFGMTCLDSAYMTLKNQLKAAELLEERAIRVHIPAGEVVGVETHNDDVLKLAQKQGAVISLRKDPEKGHIRIKARPDATLDLRALYDAILPLDHGATWFYHQSGKMVLNSSRKDKSTVPSTLPLQRILDLIQELYG